MRALVLALAAFVAIPATAGAVFRDRSTTVRLTDKPCDGVPAQLLGEEDAKAFRHADITFQGRSLSACWSLQDDKVLLVDEESDSGYVPASAFKPDGA